MKIWGVRSGMIGDMIMALPILNWLEQIYPHSYKYWVIGQRFSQALPLFINHPMIDKIHILKTAERYWMLDI
jgi:ADP-heptose:LPS heptosyltransferase